MTLFGHVFRHEHLAYKALTHRSCGAVRNEQLEFLGDSVLGLVVVEALYLSGPDRPEGELAQAKARAVCTDALYAVALRLGLGQHLRLGRSEEMSGGRHKKSILADAVEAVIGAIYMDGGMLAARKWIFANVVNPKEIS